MTAEAEVPVSLCRALLGIGAVRTVGPFAAATLGESEEDEGVDAIRAKKKAETAPKQQRA